MTRRTVSMLAAVLLVGVAVSGCSKKFSCKAFGERVGKCKKELAGAMLKETAKEVGKLDEAQKKAALAMAEKNVEKQAEHMVKFFSSEEFLKDCREAKGKTAKKAKELFTGCFKKSGCKAFAECVVAAGREL